MDGIVFKKFNLSKPKEFSAFQNYKGEFLKLLASSYRKYFGDDRYKRKIDKRNLTILLAFYNNVMIGCLIVKEYERMSGLAVLKEYRRKGVATLLVKEAQKSFSYLYGEVSLTSHDMQGLLKDLSFEIIRDKATIAALLSKQKDEFYFVHETEEYLSFIHDKDRNHIDRRKEFIIYHYEAVD